MNKTDQKNLYAEHQEFSFILPAQFLLVCRLLQVPPQLVLYQFMCNVGQESYASGEDQKSFAAAYIINCKYGRQLYRESDIRQMFVELDTIGSLWPKNGSMNLLDLHGQWRGQYLAFWFRKWLGKIRRRR